ncbi:Qat anti-phage system QueC-like protein QatC [Clostridium butyricum]|uniref:Qat anti-phage system QueC-like protein QatC n=1 Tax=Clostridium butyricum TaxID=1492 RepID=UPI0012B88473|nr:Qat anti-phage system QueC-like protein QatC [Clostridium butyricum]
MDIWIKKCNDEEPNNEFKESFIFSIDHEKKATIFSSVKDIWRRLSANPISSIYEDLSIIALSIFAIDKRASRWFTEDKWTRELKVSIPVINYEKWNCTAKLWNETLSFLTGDIWNVNFRETDKVYGNYSQRKKEIININDCTAVSLFSGGLDSFCGAIKLVSEGESVCFVGHNEYPKLAEKQEILKNSMQESYPNQHIEFLGFTANSRAPHRNDEILQGSENTSRGRSLLFLSIAVSIAGIIGDSIPVYIPENGFIGLNIPLTNSRKGTCSTRTTHPFFLRKFNEILKVVGINNNIINFFAYKTKREIVNMVKNHDIFKKGVGLTISCSHPCLPRWNKEGDKTYPRNCGYCYPCLIRKSSLIGLNIQEIYTIEDSLSLEFLTKNDSNKVKNNDGLAVINSVFRYNNLDDNELRRLIRCTGPLTTEEVNKFLVVYKETMKDIIEMVGANEELKQYMGVNVNE